MIEIRIVGVFNDGNINRGYGTIGRDKIADDQRGIQRIVPGRLHFHIIKRHTIQDGGRVNHAIAITNTAHSEKAVDPLDKGQILQREMHIFQGDETVLRPQI